MTNSEININKSLTIREKLCANHHLERDRLTKVLVIPRWRGRMTGAVLAGISVVGEHVSS
jgi:hypothetical protein